MKIYLDDIRTPVDKDWLVVKNYEEFVKAVDSFDIDQIECISLDHDLDYTAMAEYFNSTDDKRELNYELIKEKTGMDCAKYLVEKWINTGKTCKVMIHSANEPGSINMKSYINSYKKSVNEDQDCQRWIIPHTLETQIDE
jgi:hypothetical protein